MALEIIVPSSLGIDMTYHIPDRIMIDVLRQEVVIGVGSFVSAEARQKGAESSQQMRGMVLPFSEIDTVLLSAVRKAVYGVLLAGCRSERKPEDMPDFREAKEV